jgi:hypothetical protein
VTTPSILIERARTSIDERGELPYPVRADLRAAVTAEGGRVAWARLEQAAALHVKDHWVRRFPTENGPWALLDEAVRSLETGRTFEAGDRFGHWWRFIDDAHADAPDFRPTYAGYAALAAAASALFESEAPEGASELDFDPYSWDACFHASLAASGGATWEEGVGYDAARRSFWDWYLGVVEAALAPSSAPTP